MTDRLLSSLWSRWISWARLEVLRGRTLQTMILAERTHRDRVHRLVAAAISIPMIRRYDLDDPRIEEAQFIARMNDALDRKRNTRTRTTRTKKVRSSDALRKRTNPQHRPLRGRTEADHARRHHQDAFRRGAIV